MTNSNTFIFYFWANKYNGGKRKGRGGNCFGNVKLHDFYEMYII